MSEPIPSEYEGWWRIVETSPWVDDGLDILGPALLSLPRHDDRLRRHSLLAYVNCNPTKTGAPRSRTSLSRHLRATATSGGASTAATAICICWSKPRRGRY